MYRLILIIRYLLKRRITLFAIAAVALCVFIVVVVMTVMSGLVGEFKQKNHAFFGDCIVGTESLVGFPYYEEFMGILEGSGLVAGVSPVVRNYALMSIVNYDNRPFGVEIMGLDPVRHSRTTNFGQTLHFREDRPEKAFQPPYDPNAHGSVWGADVVYLKDGQGRYAYGTRLPALSITLTCFPLNAKGAPVIGSNPVRTLGFQCSDFSHSGIARVDDALVYIPLEQAQVLCMIGAEKRVSAIYLRFQPQVGVEEGTRRVDELWRQFKQAKAEAPNVALLDTVRVQDWKGYRRAMIAPMEKEQTLLGLMFVLVGITTVFIIFVVFYMIVTHKRKDIGVLKSVGASSAGVLSLFCGFAFCVGLIGSSTGTLLGWLLLANINRIEHLLFERFGWQLWDRTIYAIGDIPHRIEPQVIAVVIGSAILACLIGALVPSYLAARLRPVETLHAVRT